MKISRFLKYTNHKLAEKGFRKKSPIYHSLKNISHQHNEGRKRLPYGKPEDTDKKEIKDTRQWDECPCSWADRIHIVKMATLQKTIYRFNEILTNSKDSLQRTKKILNFYGNTKSVINLDERTYVLSVIILSDPKLYYKALVTKTAWRCHTKKNVYFNGT